MTKNRLSHSACSTYQSCAKKYELHYLQKLRSTVTHAALLFGSAIDLAVSAMLEDHKRENIDHLGQKYESVFINNWREGKVNNSQVSLYDNVDLVYAASDFDPKLFSDKDWMGLLTAGQNVYLGNKAFTAITSEAILDVYRSILADKESKGWENVEENRRKFYNFCNWTCLTKKGLLMLKAYREEVLPKIKKVLAIQKEIKIENDEGDSIIGYIDFIAEWEDGKIYVFDNKTAARDYEWDAVEKSPQLTLYVHAVENEYNTRNAGFIVMGKAIEKNTIKNCSVCHNDGTESRAKTCDAQVQGPKKMIRCGGAWNEIINPKATIQILKDEIPARVDELVLENMMDVNAAIKTGIFPRNLSACEKPFLCQFRDLCWKNKMTGLVDLKEGKE